MKTPHLEAKRGLIQVCKPFSEESLFWHSVWNSSGCLPQGDHLINVMMTSKLQYKYAIRRPKRASEKKFLQGVLKGGWNIFSKIKKLRGKA